MMRKRSNQLRAGFTLLELLMVLAILAIIVGLVAPSLRGFTIGRRGRYAATQFVSLARYARTQAVTEARTYRLNLDPSGRAFYLSADDAGSFKPPTNDFGKRIDLPAGVSIETDLAARDDGQYIEFHASGLTDPAIVTFRNEGSDATSVTCESATELFHVVEAREAAR